MRYRAKPHRTLLAACLAVAATTAGAQGGPSLDDFSLSPGLSSPSTGGGTGGAQTLDEIVAVVGDGVVLESELDNAVAQIRARAGQRVNQAPPNVLRSQVLDRIILQRLQMQRAEQRGIQVSDEEIDQGIARIARQNNMDMAQFTRAVAGDGMSMQQLREQVRNELMISKLRRQEVMSQVVVTDADVDRYLENQSLREAENRSYRLRRLLISVAPDADDAALSAARERIDRLRTRIVDEGADFASVAASQSQGEYAADGGDMGWIAGDALPEALTDVVPGLQRGEISDVFRGPDGFQIVRLEARRGGASAPAEQRVMVDEVKARHILLRPNEIRDDERTRELARQLRERLEAGADFAALARDYSDDSATASQGGDMGWVQPQRLPGASRAQLADLEAGEVSRIFQTGNGYEIVKVEDRRQRDQTREAVRAEARQALGEQKSEEEGQLWLRKLRDEAYVDIRMPGYQSTPTAGGG